MVSLALLLLTVSTLATQGNALPTDIKHECEGNILCEKKPAGYPQEEIDRLVLKNLPYLSRMKRQAPSVSVLDMKLDDSTPGGNCAIRKENKRIYTIRRKKGLPAIVVQSKWFNQTITEVTCTNDPTMESGCFSSLTNVGVHIKTKCQTKYLSFLLDVYDQETDSLVHSYTPIGVDCSCMVFD